jgi:pilus assembly protein CpaB
MNSRKSMMISAAAGLLAAVLAYVWFAGKERALADAGAPAPVLVAVKHIPSGTRLDVTLVSVKNVPRGFIQPGALRAPDEAAGLLALAPIAAGEQVLANKLASSGVTLALAVPPGKRAVTLSVEPAACVAGLLKPGDLVDVFVSTEEGQNPRTFALIQGAPVLAMGRAFTPQPAANERNWFTARQEQEGTVTLAASPYEAEQLTHLEVIGRIKLVLRAPGDKERQALPVLTGRMIRAAPVSEDDEIRRR